MSKDKTASKAEGNVIDTIRKDLFDMQDLSYADFQANLTPTKPREDFIGVRTPQLRNYAKKLAKDSSKDLFLAMLPHKYFEENQLQAFVIAQEKDFNKCVDLVEDFLPYIDNWATCDQLSPKIFKKHKKELLPYICKWFKSDMTYTVRFAIGMLMQHFLDEDFEECYPQMVAEIVSDEYYVKMEQAWYFATALAKQYDAVLPFIEEKKMEKWTHNKAIQKSIESYRITPEQKKYLRSLKQ